MDRRSERAKPRSGEAGAPGHPQLHIGGSGGGREEVLPDSVPVLACGPGLQAQVPAVCSRHILPSPSTQVTDHLRLWVPLEAVCGHVFCRCEIWGPYTPHLLAPGKP